MTKIHEPLFHLSKRNTVSAKRAWALRIIAFLLSMVACAVVSIILTKTDLNYFVKYFFQGVFGIGLKDPSINLWDLFRETAILVLVAIAVTPCFKMKFWNIGGEGQILMGALGCSIMIFFLNGKVGTAGTIILSLIVAIAFGVAWSVIPAIFKAKWNTNETLLTLMMNYIAVNLTGFFIKTVSSGGSGILSFYSGYSVFPPIAGNKYILSIIVAAVITTFMAIYLKFSKHGYELTVVGESPNTAKYVGINTKVVIVRTLVLCGVLCGMVGFLLVSVTNWNLDTASTVGGRGFVGVLISWLSHFNPIAMVLVSFLVVFIKNGSLGLSFGGVTIGTSYPDIMAGVFFLFIIAVEFFINYKFIFREDIQSRIDSVTEKVKLTFTKKKKAEVANDSAENTEAAEAVQDSEEPAEEAVEESTDTVEELEETPSTEEAEAKEEK